MPRSCARTKLKFCLVDTIYFSDYTEESQPLSTQQEQDILHVGQRSIFPRYGRRLILKFAIQSLSNAFFHTTTNQ